MSSKRILFLLITVAAILATVFLLRRTISPEDSAPQEKQGSTATFFKSGTGELTPAESKINCAKPAAARASVGDEINRFWQNTEEDKVETFLHYDGKSRVLTVCHKGQNTAAILAADPAIEKVELVRISEAQFMDMNADGKNEFLVFQGQCVEGPCVGTYQLYQLDGGRIRKLYTLHAESVEVVNESGRTGLRMEKYCFTHDFGMGPAYFSVAEFQNGELRTVPYQQLRSLFPEAVAQMKPSQDIGLEEDSPAQQKVYLKIHDLIVQAYAGKPRAQLMQELDAAVGELLPVEGETSPTDRLALYCDPREILELISGED